MMMMMAGKIVLEYIPTIMSKKSLLSTNIDEFKLYIILNLICILL